jgi:hypothetical protein
MILTWNAEIVLREMCKRQAVSSCPLDDIYLKLKKNLSVDLLSPHNHVRLIILFTGVHTKKIRVRLKKLSKITSSW